MKRIFSRFFVLSILGLLSFHTQAQNTFPEGWVGEYQGTLEIIIDKGVVDTIPVDFVMKEIEKDSVWTYTMSYHSARYGELVKDYRYVRVRKNDPNHYLFDELNGIVMELTLMNDCFYGMYEVSDMYFFNTLRKEGDGLYFELTMSPGTEPKLSAAEEEGETFEAKSYKPNQVQAVHLKRKR
jgi:hypothetical protein